MRLSRIKRGFMTQLSLFGATLSAAHGALPVPEVETLPNGLTVAWFLSDRLPVFDAAVLVQSGSRDDLRGKSGSAELLAAALDRGVAGKSAQESSREVARLGASRYVSADDDTLTVGVHGLATDSSQLLTLLSEVVLRPNLDPAEIAREHARLAEQWKHVGDSADTLASIAFARKLASGTDYARGSSLSLDEFKRLEATDVKAYYRKHFTPSNSVLMIVGRASRVEMRKRIDELFLPWSGSAPSRTRVRVRIPRLEVPRGTVLVLDKPGSTQAQVRMGLRLPLIDSPNRYPLAVANALFGEYFLSRLNAVIRDELGLTYGIGSSVTYDPGLARFAISSATQSEHAGKLIRKSIDLLEDLRSQPIPEAELAQAKEYLVGGFPIGMSTLSAVATRWLAGYVFRLGPGYLNEYIPRVSAVTAEGVAKAVREDLRADQLSIVVAGDARAITRSLHSAGFKVKQVTVRDLF